MSNWPRIMNASGREVPEPDVEALLLEFYRSEMPRHWPTCPVPAQTTTSGPAHAWVVPGTWRRLLLSAAVVLLVVGYHYGLQPALVQPQRLPTDRLNGPNLFGQKPNIEWSRTRRGRPVELQVEPTLDPKTFILRVEELPAKK